MKKKRNSKSMILLLCALFGFLLFGMFFSSCDKNSTKEENTASENTEVVEEEVVGEKPIVVLDAAFGGELTGYVGIVNEADLNAEIVEAIKTRLEEDNRFTTVLTHEKNTSASVLDKAAFINETNPALFITICAENSNNPDASGMHVYADKPDSETAEESLRLAKCIQEKFNTEEKPVDVRYRYFQSIGNNTYQIKNVDVEDKEPKNMATWLILEETNTVGVVVQQMYVTSQSDIDTYKTPEGLSNIAEAYYEIICEYLGLK